LPTAWSTSFSSPAGSRRWLLHPFLVAIWFVLTLAAANVSALRGWQDLTWPICISLGVCTGSWIVGFAVTRNADKASLISLLWIVAFSIFGYVAEPLHSADVPAQIGGEPVLGALFILALFGPTLAVSRMGRRLEPVNRYLSLVAAALVGYTTARVFLGLRDDPGIVVPPSLPHIPDSRGLAGELPDIYLLVLDKYTAGEVLADHFGYDNSGFEEFLRSRGFVLPRHARSNYPTTQLALTSMLNLDYIQNLARPHLLNDPIENNRLAGFLKREGYRFVFFPTPYEFTSKNRHADLQLPPPREIAGEFRAAWERTTPLPELVRAGCAVAGCQPGRFRATPESAELMDWKFGQLSGLAGHPRPTFVFAHLVLPHEPFLYRPDCSHRDPYWPINAGRVGDEKATRAYLDQISCVNRKVSALVDSILARSRRPAVILLQSDHGHGRIGRTVTLEEVDGYRLKERMAAFTAYRFPGLDPGSVGDSITPVNAMRLMLRHYFGAALPPVEDVSYWSSETHPLQFDRIVW
jgi:hypothetical protein